MILFNDITEQWNEIKQQAIVKIDDFLSSQDEIILSDPVDNFEKRFAKINNNKYAIGVSNGTDAIKIALKSLGVSESTKVIIQSNTWMSTLISVLDLTENFALIDCDDHYQLNIDLLEKHIEKGCVLVIAHMYGHSCDMRRIMDLKQRHEFKLIEDCSQSFGTVCHDDRRTGNFGDASVFSLHPRKNLGSCGDAGVIVTDNSLISKKCRLLRNLGSDKNQKQKHKILGWNHRLDSIQAIILNEKLCFVEDWNRKKIEIANTYSKHIKNKKVTLPKTAEYCSVNSFYVYPLLVEDRDHFVQYMKNNNIETRIQYPISIEKLECFSHLNIRESSHNTNKLFDRIVSIPLHPFLKDVDHIIDKVNNFR